MMKVMIVVVMILRSGPLIWFLAKAALKSQLALVCLYKVCRQAEVFRSNEYAEFDGFAVHVENQNQLPSFPELPLSICPTRLSLARSMVRIWTF